METEKKKIASDWLWTNSEMFSQGSLSDCLKPGVAVRRPNSELFLIIMTIFELLVSAAALLPTSTDGHCWGRNQGRVDTWLDSGRLFL